MIDVKSKIEELNAEVYELHHAFRVNGVIDIYKIGYTVYCKPENFYYKHENQHERLLCIEKLIKKYPKQEVFAKTKNGISYQEFKNNKLQYEKPPVNAEDYHWKINSDKTSEDHLYFIFHGDFIKIGRSRNISKRLSALSTSFGDDYETHFVNNKGFMEPILHNCFSDFRSKREWFHDNTRIRDFIKKNAMLFVKSK